MSRPLFYLLAFLWLPAGVVASALFRFGVAGTLREWLLPLTAGPVGLPLAERIAIAASMWLPRLTVAPAGLPLALAGARLSAVAPQGLPRHRVGSDGRAGGRHRRRHPDRRPARPRRHRHLRPGPQPARLARRPPPPRPQAIAPFKPARVASHAPPGLQRRVGNTRTKQLTFLRSLT